MVIQWLVNKLHSSCEERFVNFELDDRGIWVTYICTLCGTVRTYFLKGISTCQ